MNTTRTKTIIADGNLVADAVTVFDLTAQLDASIWNWSKDNPSANVFDIKYSHTVQMNVHYFTAVVCYECDVTTQEIAEIVALASKAVDKYNASDIPIIEGDDEEHEQVKQFQESMALLRESVIKYAAGI